MERLSYRGGDFKRTSNIMELSDLARRRLPNFVYEYVQGGSDDEVTLANNRAVFDHYRFTPKTLTDVSQRSLKRRLFGRDISMPVVIGPTGYNGLITKDGDLKLARAAAANGIPFTLSNVSTSPLEEVAATSGGWQWMQVYFYRDREYVVQLLKRIKAAGYDTIAVTTDSAIYGNREWDVKNFSRPFVLNWRNKFHVLSRLRWVKDVLYPNGMPSFKNLGDLLPPEIDSVKGASSELGKHLMPSLNWEDIKWIRDQWSGNLILKGVLSVEEAKTAVSYGVDGVILSNHGGRQLDSSVSPMEILAEVKAAVGDKLAVMLDSGFRRGNDILKAIALGADAVLVARTTLYGLAAGGEEGANHALGILRSEMDRNLGLLGCSNLDELDESYIRYAR